MWIPNDRNGLEGVKSEVTFEEQKSGEHLIPLPKLGKLKSSIFFFLGGGQGAVKKYLSQHKKVKNGRWVLKLIYVQLEFISEVYFKGGTPFSDDFFTTSKAQTFAKDPTSWIWEGFLLRIFLLPKKGCFLEDHFMGG